MTTVAEYCPYCDEEHKVERHEDKMTVSIRGESITVDAWFYKCPVSVDEDGNNEWETMEREFSPFDTAIGEYNRRHPDDEPADMKDLTVEESGG
jgi:hypothetical protein